MDVIKLFITDICADFSLMLITMVYKDKNVS